MALDDTDRYVDFLLGLSGGSSSYTNPKTHVCKSSTSFLFFFQNCKIVVKFDDDERNLLKSGETNLTVGLT